MSKKQGFHDIAVEKSNCVVNHSGTLGYFRQAMCSDEAVRHSLKVVARQRAMNCTGLREKRN